MLSANDKVGKLAAGKASRAEARKLGMSAIEGPMYCLALSLTPAAIAFAFEVLTKRHKKE